MEMKIKFILFVLLGAIFGFTLGGLGIHYNEFEFYVVFGLAMLFYAFGLWIGKDVWK